jgi:hypothetical protein
VPELPARGWVLFAALATFAAVVMGVLLWASLSGQAGAQRGLVIHNELQVDLVVSIEGSSDQQVVAAGHEETFVVRREQFPARIIWSLRSRDGRDSELYQYRDLVAAEFRLSIDVNGIYSTTDYRDTPAP